MNVHLYTLQKYGIASNNLHDELIADYIEIVKQLDITISHGCCNLWEEIILNTERTRLSIFFRE
jgi:hypothetical protein